MERQTKITIKYWGHQFSLRLAPRESSQSRDTVISFCVVTATISISKRKDWVHRVSGASLEDVRSCDALKKRPFSYTVIDLLRDNKHGLIVVFNRETGKPELYYTGMWQRLNDTQRLERERLVEISRGCFNVFSVSANTDIMNYKKLHQSQKIVSKKQAVKAMTPIRHNCQARQLSGKTMREHNATRKK